MAFNLDGYETVKERKKRFYLAHPDGRIIVNIENDDIEDKAIVKATIYLNREDHEKGLPRSHGYALEIRDKELSKNKFGKEFESVNFTSWVENCEESAVGRALDNAGFGSDKASRDEMQKAQRMATSLAISKPKPVDASPTGAKSEITFGKFRGKNYADIPLGEMVSYAEYLTKTSKEQNKPLSGPTAEFVRKADERAKVSEAAKKPVAKPTVEDLPF